MRLVCFVSLAIIVLAVYLAQYIFDHRSLLQFFPQRLLDTFPSLYQLTRWLPEDLLTLATALSTLGTLGFGLLITQWAGEEPFPSLREASSRVHQAHSISGSVHNRICFILLSLALMTSVPIRIFMNGEETLGLQLVWVSGLILYCGGSLLLDSRTLSSSPDDASLPKSNETDPDVKFC